MTSSQAFEVLIPHVVSTLPDSLTGRAQVLLALCLCVPRGHRWVPFLLEMQVHLDVHQRLQGAWRLKESTLEGREE